MARYGFRIKTVREELGLSQAELAIGINVSQGSISGWEKGISFPSEKVLDVLIKTYGIKREFLLNNEEAH